MKKTNPFQDEQEIKPRCWFRWYNDCPIYFDCLSSILKDDDFNVYDPRDVDPDLFYDIMY